MLFVVEILVDVLVVAKVLVDVLVVVEVLINVDRLATLLTSHKMTLTLLYASFSSIKSSLKIAFSQALLHSLVISSTC